MSRLLLLLSALSLPAIAAEPTLFGRYEQIKIEDIGKVLKAKMDTGAMTASLSARDWDRDGVIEAPPSITTERQGFAHVAVVHVPIDDQQPDQPVFFLRVASGDRNAVE